MQKGQGSNFLCYDFSRCFYSTSVGVNLITRGKENIKVVPIFFKELLNCEQHSKYKPSVMTFIKCATIRRFPFYMLI